MFRQEKATWGKATPAQPSPPRLSFDIKIWGPSRYSQAPPLVTFRIRHWVGATVIWLEPPPLNPNYVELEQKPRSREGPSSLALISHGYPGKKKIQARITAAGLPVSQYLTSITSFWPSLLITAMNSLHDSSYKLSKQALWFGLSFVLTPFYRSVVRFSLLL